MQINTSGKLFATIPGMLVATLVLILALTTAGCSTNERVDNSGNLAAEIKAKQIKRFTQADLTEALQKTGEKIAASATQALDKAEKASFNCTSDEFGKTLTPVKNQLASQVSLVFAKDTGNTQLHSKEIDLLKAYLYQSAQPGTILTDHLQKIDESVTIYYAPLKDESEIIQNCIGTEQSPFVLWRIVLNQKEVIRHIQ